MLRSSRADSPNQSSVLAHRQPLGPTLSARPASSRTVLLMFALGCIILAAATIAVFVSFAQLVRVSNHQKESHEALQTLYDLTSSVNDAEMALRGILLTDDDNTYLTAYNQALARLSDRQKLLGPIADQDPQVEELTKQLLALIDERLDDLQQSLALYYQGRHEEALAVVRKIEMRRLVSSIRQASLHLIERQEVVIAQRTEKMSRTVGTAQVILGLTALIMLAVLGLAGWRLHRSLKDSEQADLSLLKQQRFLEKVNATSPDLIYIYDIVERRLTYHNQAVVRTYGYPSHELAQPNFSLTLLHPDNAPSPIDWERLRHLPDGLILRNEIRIRRADGQWRWLATHDTVFERDANGLVRSLLGTAQDITERKESERAMELAKTNAELANRAKSEFLANISHELRTPLNGILGMLELTLSESLRPDQYDRLTLAKEAADTLLTLVNDLLDLSKIDAGKFDIVPVPCDVQRELTRTLRTLAGRTYEKRLELVCDIDPDVPATIIADPDRLRQIWVNLVGNAIKFTEHGGVIVSCSVVPTTEQPTTSDPTTPPRVWLKFSVRDTGIGISTDQLKRIFEPFEQADNSKARRYGGTGLGLSIVRRLVELMNGQLEAHSTPGQGSTFSFTVPVGVQASESTTSADLSKLAVLLVDDTRFHRPHLAKALQHYVSYLGQAQRLDQAVSLLAQRAFDVVILNEEMIDSNELLTPRRFREQTAYSGPLLVLRTGLTPSHDHSDDHRADAVLTRPHSPCELLEALTQLMQTRPTAPANNSTQRRPTGKLTVPLRVLVAEDNRINQRLTEELLIRLGAVVRVVSDGAQAVSAWSSELFDLILMDVQMPGIDGLQATQTIRARESQLPNHPRIPIIALTARAMREDVEQCLAVGMTGYLSKPLDPEQLRRTLLQITESLGHVSTVEPGQTNGPPGPQLPVLQNPQRLVDELGLILDELIDLLRQDGATMLQAVRQAASDGQLRELTNHVHKLSGAVSNFNALACQRVAQCIELAARNGDLAAARAALPQLEQEYTRLLAALDELRATQHL